MPITSQNAIPLAEFLNSSKDGDHITMPRTFGMTSIIIPEIDDLAGKPTLKPNFPEKSNIPQENITERTSPTTSELKTRSPVVGQTPPFANVEAITDKTSQVDSKLDVC